MDTAPGELDCPLQAPPPAVDGGNPVGELGPGTEDLRESLRKQLEFCFSRENLSKDVYLVSQMDSDHFVPIWTIANIDGIKKLTTDLELIIEVLRSSPLVQVDDKGEKARPNHKRCIIILREIPEATPVEDVQALFRSESCPPVIGCEFAHNNNWYITFQSDSDAQQAFRYLREEVKTFQGKPILARIKAKPIAINTFFPKNGYRVLDSSLYPQQPQSQQQYASPLFMQPVYSPQQQYPLYSLLPQTWSPSQPYFETPLAPFPNSPFVNGFSSAGAYKSSSSPQCILRPDYRNRRGAYRGRRRRDEDRSVRPPPSEVPAVKLDLAPSNFPPLPGAVLSSQGESVLESRMSDVVRGVSKDKEMSKDAGTSPPVPAAVDVPHDPPPPPISTEPCVNLTLSPEPAAPTVSSPQPPDQSPTELTIQRDSHPRSAASSPLAATKPDRNTVTPLSEPRKLSYAEVCQRPPAAHPAREPRLGAAKGEEVAGAGGAGGGGGTGERQADRPQERPEGRTKECPAPRGGPPSPGGVRSGSGKANEQPPQQQQQQPQPAPQQQQQQQQQQQRRPFTHRSLPQGPARRSAKEQNVLLRSPK